MRFYHDQQISPRQGSPPTLDQSPKSKILVMSPSTFITTRRAISPFLLRPAPTMTTPTLIDLINNLAYLVSPSRSSAGAFSNPSI
jgi:hypothetical protein